VPTLFQPLVAVIPLQFFACELATLLDMTSTSRATREVRHGGVMIVGIGVDVCDISRWREMVARRPGAVDRLLTPAEATLNHTSQAGRFAAKRRWRRRSAPPEGSAGRT